MPISAGLGGAVEGRLEACLPSCHFYKCGGEEGVCANYQSIIERRLEKDESLPTDVHVMASPPMMTSVQGFLAKRQ